MGTIPDRQSCFSPVVRGKKYTAEVSCSICGKLHIVEISKTKLLKYLRNAIPILCPQCRKEAEEKEAEIKRQRTEQSKIFIQLIGTDMNIFRK